MLSIQFMIKQYFYHDVVHLIRGQWHLSEIINDTVCHLRLDVIHS